MMDIYHEITLGLEAMEYLKECLLAGHTLSNLLLRIIDLDHGVVSMFLPSGVKTNKVTQFKTGGILPVPVKSQWHDIELKDCGRATLIPLPNVDEWLAQVIVSFLNEDSKNLCVFEDALAIPTDPRLSHAAARIMVFGSEVYHVLKGHNEYDVVKQTIRQAKSIPVFIGILTTLSDDHDPFNDKSEMSSSTLQILAQNTRRIIVGAYDGEGYLIWRK